MTNRKRRWLIAGGVACVLAIGVVTGIKVAGSRLRKRFEPWIRQQAVTYLQRRFDSDVELKSLRIRIPPTSPFSLLSSAGRGTVARVEGAGLTLHQRGAADFPPILVLKKFSFEIDLGTVFDPQKIVNRVTLDGMEITVPPKGRRTALPKGNAQSGSSGGVVVREVIAANSRLVILPKTPGKDPLVFDIAELYLKSAGRDVAMQYRAILTNPKPPGLIHSTGSFGPWVAEEPGDTPLKGDYTFDNADLGVFKAISGTLHSTGRFEGTLSAIVAKGVASVPNFRLKRGGNPVGLTTDFEVLVDGGNGDTILRPVRATLGSTKFTTSGAVIKKDGDLRRTIDLDVSMPSGNLNDILRLAMNGTPFMEGKLALKTRITIPPLTGKVKDKLMLDGTFSVSDGRFLKSEIQGKIDGLSRRGQGQPANEEITAVISGMKGSFRLEENRMTFRSLSFSTTGADVNLSGDYDMAGDALDFHGTLALQARMSQTMTGWKRWALKPADPFFAKNGAGTFLRIKIDGSSKSPDFGLDHDKSDQGKSPAGAATAVAR